MKRQTHHTPFKAALATALAAAALSFAVGDVARAQTATPQEIELGREIDRCSGVLSVLDRNKEWIEIPRGRWTTVDVAVDGRGYWYWKCGKTKERSRGGPNFRQRVKRLKVWHSTNSRKITWLCFDLQP